MDLFDLLEKQSDVTYCYLFYTNGELITFLDGNRTFQSSDFTDIVPFVFTLPSKTTRARFNSIHSDIYIDIEYDEYLRLPNETFYQYVDRINERFG